MNRYKTCRVLCEGQRVGTLATDPRHRVAFEYDEEWLVRGFSLNPLSLPLEKKVFLPRGYDPFEGLFGVFADSLPDGWGRMVVDRLLRKNNINAKEIDSLTRLTIVGASGMGALCYEPENDLPSGRTSLSLDQIAEECQKIFADEVSGNLDDLFRMGGSSGGARPKVFYQLDGEEWIVKFPSSLDDPDIGDQEYAYSLCARKCGLEVPEKRLLPSPLCSGYIAVKRIDRKEGRRIHMVSASGLLETSHRIPNLDYIFLMQLTMALTHDYQEIEKLYRLMCFNVFAHNRDDHSKNFSWLYENGRWRLSPAYDLTYSSSLGGEHATTINGNGRDPGLRDLLAVAEKIRLDSSEARQIAEETQEIVQGELGRYLN
ncbi:MAG: type II toxin-antitoxin system HipA family toxin [Lachnospiraceae bacterium]|nr:type II toxin-antitoxin system HipA family toxin [Lachnospiraceae bacterium]